MKKIFILIGITIFLTLLGDRASSALYQFQSNSMGKSLELIGSNFLFVLISNALMYAFDMFRMKLIGRIFDLSFSWKDCFGGVTLNLLFGWISPMAILGAPAMAWYLFKRGYPIVESISVSFVRSFSIILTSALTTIVIFTFNLQGEIQNPVLQEKVFQVLTGIAIYIGVLILFSYLPFPFIKNINVLDKITSQIRVLLKNGKILMMPVLFITLILNFMLVSFIMYEGSNYHTNYTSLLGQVMLFLSYMLLMPTPGASGLAEVGAPLIFSAEIPKGDIISIVTAMRVSTIGIQVGLGVLFIMMVLKQNLTIEEIKNFKKQNG